MDFINKLLMPMYYARSYSLLSEHHFADITGNHTISCQRTQLTKKHKYQAEDTVHFSHS